MIVFPQAKINIGLNIVEKRNDGFHNLESIFYPVAHLFDVLEVIENKGELGNEFVNTGISIPGEARENLCLKAWQLLHDDHNIPCVKMHLHKVIPIGAGLGGGSADASYALKALDQLFELHLSDEILIDYARQLGSDCAFFVHNKPVYAYERGDAFKPISLDLSDYRVEITYPNIHVSTQEAYQGVTPEPSKLLELHINAPIDEWKNGIVNDFEAQLSLKYPAIAKAKLQFYNDGAVYASMTGSGSAVYGIFRK